MGHAQACQGVFRPGTRRCTRRRSAGGSSTRRMAERWTISLGAERREASVALRISREHQDVFALRSHQLAARAFDEGAMGEVVPVAGVELERDEGIRPDGLPPAARQLRPAFVEGGTVTAGELPPLNDGASSCCSGTSRRSAAWPAPLARIVSSAAHGVDPDMFGIAPVEAANKALARAGIGWAEIDAVELNEAFASQSLACLAGGRSSTPRWSTCGAARSRSATRSALRGRESLAAGPRAACPRRRLRLGHDLYRRRPGPRGDPRGMNRWRTQQRTAQIYDPVSTRRSCYEREPDASTRRWTAPVQVDAASPPQAALVYLPHRSPRSPAPRSAAPHLGDWTTTSRASTRASRSASASPSRAVCSTPRASRFAARS